MPEADPNDDSLWRWVLQHYRYDPQRHQRRNTTVAAYDNAAEFEAAFTTYSQRIQADIDAGDRDPRERVSGVIWHPGYHEEQARGRFAGDAVRRGVDPRPALGDGRLPSNVSLFGWDDDGGPWSAGGGEPPTPPVN